MCLLDYVTLRYRDFSPGEFVWRRSGLLMRKGLSRVVTPPNMIGAYYDRLGFRPDGARLGARALTRSEYFRDPTSKPWARC